MPKEKFVVCPECQGKGRVLGSAFYGQALDEDLVRDEDFMEGYLGGAYDVRCHLCNGLRVVDENKKFNPCESCGEEMSSSSYQEYPGAQVWTDWNCNNPDCDE